MWHKKSGYIPIGYLSITTCRQFIAERSMQNRLVLIIEDEPHNQMLFRDLLEREGYAVQIAGDAESGIEIARRVRPALILMDIALPGMDGLEATRLLSADSKTQDIDSIRAHDAGCLGYLIKPICIHTFRQSVALFLNGGAQLAAAA
jgi:CheY-like chemotaxis protein